MRAPPSSPAELICPVRGYRPVSPLLNAYGMSAPGREQGLPDDERESAA